MNKAVVIVAGGKGTRMGSSISKQYLPIGGKPILMHTLSTFYTVDPSMKLILVIPDSDFNYWKELCDEFQFKIPHDLVPGGNSRFQSVRNGLDKITWVEGLVAIHDGVRPFVSKDVILNSFSEAEKSGSAIAVVALKDSIRKLSDDGNSRYQERQYFRLVQTPQTFQLARIKKAFQVTEIQQFTDDATVYEHQGWQVSLIAGNPENIKITTPEDMDYGEFLLSKKKKN
ncbi:2-C-methyl-D-erythritol 4-phosphate cytidylyltransferase [Algoriphagus sp.]|uniref:2-C-methyl-D-erythritol 4-phosphate cytidylyltransferase n=1 Tax=Algoriphagus sp. TaxID=1872435 RepID=UPI0025FCC193|nr:2-C-methyl-D-erythritol 4-phosphate cytidylyltransferase [Algoriphagus sp.]